MTSEFKPVVTGVPVFGIISVTAPFIGMALIYVLLRWLGATEFGFFSALLLIPLSPLCGIAFALGARKRGEPYKALPLIGLLLNLAILCFLIANANHAIHNLNWGG